MQFIKDWLVRQGPDARLVHAALLLKGASQGFRLRFFDGRISIEKANRRMILNEAQYVQVPLMMNCYDFYFETVASTHEGEFVVLDFSRPALHRYSRSGASLWFPSIPEDDSMYAYTHWYQPGPGDVVWDAGAHAGATSYFLAQLVGPEGKVFAFEPDDQNYEYLLRNIKMQALENVVPVKKALAAGTGTASFIMDGTMNAGISDYIHYRDNGQIRTVPTLSFADACAELGCVPRYVKMDIEGAELAVIEAAAGFLRDHPVHFAIESCHRVEGELTSKPLERLFQTNGYESASSEEFGLTFTWARPGGGPNRHA